MKTLQIGMGWFLEEVSGLSRYYYDCVSYLPNTGVDVRGLVTGTEKVTITTNRKIQAFDTPKNPLLKRWLSIRKYVKKELATSEYDLVVAHFALYTFPILNQLGDLPLVFHFHGPWALESDAETQSALAVWLKKSLEKVTYRRVNSFIVLSQAFKDILHQQYGVPLKKIHIVPGGVELAKFAVSISPIEARSQLGWEEERTIIFCIRRLAKRMGLENLLQAIDRVRIRYPNIFLYIAGKGALAETLQIQIKELNLTNHVRLLGYLPDRQLPIAYRAADFSVVPSISFEGFGLVVVESLAAGTPVMGTPIGGIPEILEPFCPDLLCEDASVDKLAQGIIEVLSQKRKLPSREDCQAYIKNNYAWPIVAQQIKSVYEQTLGQKLPS